VVEGCDKGSVLVLQVVNGVVELLHFGLVLVDDLLESLHFAVQLPECELIVLVIGLMVGFLLRAVLNIFGSVCLLRGSAEFMLQKVFSFS
jgi:hypothetical protein